MEKEENVNNEIKVEQNDSEIIQNNEQKNKKSFGFLFLFLLIIFVLGAVFLLNKDSIIEKTNGNNNFQNNNDTSTDTNTNTDTPSSTEVIETEKEKYNANYTITKNSLDNFDLAFLKIENSQNNMIYSPLSIKYALGMLMTGADGETKKQINDILGKYKFHKFSDSKNMSFANALFIKNTFKDSIKKSYVESLTKNFGADVKYDSFESPDAINKYVSKKTFKLINNLVDNVSDKDFILLNALAIDMNWVHRLQTLSEDDDNSVFSFEPFGFYPEHLDYYIAIEPLNEGDYNKLVFNDDETIRRQSVEIGAVLDNYDIVKILGKDKIKKTVNDAYKKWLNDKSNYCEYDKKKKKYVDCEDTSFDINKYIKELDSYYGTVESSTDFELYVDNDVKVFKKNLRKYNGKTLQYVGIMPTNEKLDNYINRITEEDINKLIKSTKSIKAKNFKAGVITEISGYIPLFNFNYELNLKEDLIKLGVSDVFDSEKSNLSNLTTQKSYIDEAIHKATIEFTNDGIKAAAISAMSGRGAGDGGFNYRFEPPVEKIDITFNQPFLFLIIDKDTEEVWFVGRVYEPDKYKSFSKIYAELHPDENINYFDDEDDSEVDETDDYEDDEE